MKSTARALKAAPKRYLTLFALVSFVLMIAAIAFDGVMAGIGVALLLLAGALMYLALILRQLSQFDADDRQKCLEQFRGNVRIGQLSALIWFVAYLLV